MRTDISVEIVPFEERHAEDFKRLNLEWLRKYFRVEPADEEMFSLKIYRTSSRQGMNFKLC